MRAELRFPGAARNVTGSRHLREVQGTRTGRDEHGQTERNPSVRVSESPCASAFRSAPLTANAALWLVNLCCHLLDR
jgi:hypothetical protein